MSSMQKPAGGGAESSTLSAVASHAAAAGDAGVLLAQRMLYPKAKRLCWLALGVAAT